jgi:hypothetical protein
MKQGTRLPANIEEQERVLQFDHQLLSFRQTAEWGNRALQGSFGRLRMPLEIESDACRGDLLETCIRLYQLRVRKVGINQIRTVYMDVWKENKEEERIWQHFEDILFSEQRKNDRVARFHLGVDYYQAA